ncbi:MAG: DUF4113 domain-containing protein, partial [Curvibacter sp.]
VVLMHLQREGLRQGELDLGEAPAPRPRLVQVLDQLNTRYGQDTVFLASAGLGGRARRWSMKQEHRTPRYTTRWDELLEVRL